MNKLNKLLWMRARTLQIFLHSVVIVTFRNSGWRITPELEVTITRIIFNVISLLSIGSPPLHTSFTALPYPTALAASGSMHSQKKRYARYSALIPYGVGVEVLGGFAKRIP